MRAFIKSALSEPGEGGASTARILSSLFAILAIITVAMVVHRLVDIKDVSLLSVSLARASQISACC